MAKGSAIATEDKTVDGETNRKKKTEFNLQEQIEETLKKIRNDRGDDPKGKKMPDGFEDFVRGEGFRNFLEAMLDYNRELFRLENKQHVLELEAR